MPSFRSDDCWSDKGITHVPYSQLPPTILYPPVKTSAWVVISRLREVPTRTVPDLNLIDSAEEFALPFPTGRFPQKAAQVNVETQVYDDLDRPLYDDGTPEGTASDVDMDGKYLPPKMSAIVEERLVNLRDSPEQFTLEEVLEAVQHDFLLAFPFYKWSFLHLFDDRRDSVSVYQAKAEVSGFASGGHPLWMGPIQGIFDPLSSPAGHVLLIAPEMRGINYYLQIRHGIAGANNQKGPIEDVAHASRENEIFHLYPMQDLQLTQSMLTDASGIKVSHFWIRTEASGSFVLDRPFPVIPWILILGRPTGTSGDFVST